MTAVVFDIGNVLVRWDVHLAWLDELGSREAVDTYLTRIDFFTRNLRGDKGERFTDMANELEDPADADRLRAYVGRFGATVQEKITGSWDLLCTRAGHAPQECLFIDDSPKNVDGAKQAGWDAVLFTGPEKLEADLTQRGLL